ncbi:lytic polysaccharide monooxygenase [Canariomyces notabilis]|uniref:Lytic polysaccharide monooxygenase n=1 Tax=Canariomyces notabilis TaxID=2074819 RepID=A0AAN6QCF9_9PEZI|nr:lytic polysaccharide monooxygenase [Canariomyces arenarius]
MTTKSIGAALATFLGAVNGDLIMNTPTPYNLRGTAKLLQVDHLGAKLPFPCQGATEVVSVTPLTAGSSQLVKFTGGAQHGGGSCQFALTYDYPPPADVSKWKTIYTIIGGCPVSAAGNLPVTGTDQDGRADSVQCGNDSGTECIRQFEIPVPKDIPNSNATFAWTWFNKIGNREMYMNCAPVAITGGSDDQTFFNELPTMFTANIAGACTTNNGVLNIPNPGKYGVVLEQPAADSEGTCAKASGIPTFESGGGSGGGNGTVSTSVVSAPQQSQTATATATATVNPPNPSTTADPDSACPAPSATSPSSGFVTKTSAAGSAQPTSASSGFVTKTTAAAGGGGAQPTSVASSAAPIASSGLGTGFGFGSGSSGGAQPCSANGAIVCFSETSFGLCANGLATPQQVAAGTVCIDGKIGYASAKFRRCKFW